jgi:hypothetical protein
MTTVPMTTVPMTTVPMTTVPMIEGQNRHHDRQTGLDPSVASAIQRHNPRASQTGIVPFIN